MKTCPRLHARARAGFTLLETLVALSVMGLLGYSLAVTADVGSDSQRTVMEVVAEDRALRAALETLVEDLRASRDDTVTRAELADGNHQLRFMQPIDVGGVPAWGVQEPSLEPQADWSLQYTVRTRVQDDGTTLRELVREILDDAEVVQESRVVVSGLRAGGGTSPGFEVAQEGGVWVLTLSTVGRSASTNGMKAEFHVRTRN